MTFITDAADAIGPIVVVFIAAALIALALTPVVRRIVMRYEIVDQPEARRINTIPVPRGGGLAVCAAFLLGLKFFESCCVAVTFGYPHIAMSPPRSALGNALMVFAAFEQ